MTKQLQLLSATDEPTFGRHTAAKLKEAKRANPNLSWDEIAAIIEAERAVWFPSKTVIRVKVDELFETLVKACGQSVKELTKGAARLTAVSLAHIKQATPGVTATEIERRARAYRRKYQNAAITPRALSMHWAEFPPPQADKSPLEKLYVEPEGWRDTATKLYPDADPPWSERKWFDQGVDTRAEILKAHG